MAKNSYEAVDFAAHTPPDVIIMDIAMESRMAGFIRGYIKIIKEKVETDENSCFGWLHIKSRGS